jgi:phosphonate transport system permease protein
MTATALRPPRLGYSSVSGLMLLAALIGIAIADIAVTSLDPWLELRRLAAGLLRPDLYAIEMRSVVLTVAFAVLGVGIGAGAGLAMALAFPYSRAVRVLCAFLRSIHEMFWALLLIQVTGLSPRPASSRSPCPTAASSPRCSPR